MSAPRCWLAVAVAAALGGCAAAPGPAASRSAGSAAPVVAASAASPVFVALVGPRFQHAPPFLGTPDTNYFCLRSFVDRHSGEAVHQLYVADSYAGAKRDWNAAHDPAGNALRFVGISRNEIDCTDGCSYAEEFAADLPERELRASPEGLTVTFTARSGAQKTIFISGRQIAAQLAAADAERRAPSSTAARTP
ncbi:MAG TPA: hypothetical protein VGF07_12160 [Stellaceae bacterium]|jgi:hypothetical protein